MDTIDGDFDGGKSLRRWNRALAVLAWLGIAWSAFEIGDAFVGPDFSVGLRTQSGIKLLTAADFTMTQRCTVVMIAVPQILCWIYCLSQIVRLSTLFSKGEILSVGMVQCLERFGFGLAAQGIAELTFVPILSAYLLRIEKIDSVEGMWQLLVGGGVLTSMMAAVLLVVVTRILRIGIRLREEAELTI